MAPQVRPQVRIAPQTRLTPRAAERLMHLPQVSVIIPAYNEEASLPLVLRELPGVGRVIVVDNASSDMTAGVASALGVDVVREERRGYGSACLAGIARLQRLVDSGHPPPEVVVFLDGDYSDYPEELPRLVQPILDGAADFVLGSRLLGQREAGAMPPQSVYGNRLACWLMAAVWGARYTDLGPFRAISWTALKHLGMQDVNFGWTVEMQIKARLARLRTMEIPVRYRRRVGVSKISGTLSGTVKAGAKILYTIAKYAWMTRGVRATDRRNGVAF